MTRGAVQQLLPHLVVGVLRETASELQQDARDAAQQREQVERASFVPHVWVETELAYPPLGQVAVSAFTFYRKRLRVPEKVLARRLVEQVDYVARTAARHTVECSGRIHPWGRITAYSYRRTFDDAVVLDPDGQVVNWFAKPSVEVAPKFDVRRARAPRLANSVRVVADACG